MEWAALRKRARQLERDVEALVSNYTATCASLRVDRPQASDEEAPSVFVQEEEQRASVYSLIDERMLTLPEASSPANAAVARRSVALAVEFRAEAEKASGTFRRSKESYELFHGARRRAGDTSATDSLLNERASLTSSHRMTDELLAHADETRAMLREQNRILNAASQGLNAIERRFPASRRLIHAIRNKRQRDNMIVAAVIAVCICLTLLFVLR